MSCNYADGLSPYDNKGLLGLSEKFDSKDEVQRKCEELAKLIKESKHVVFHSGAGISTSAGIPDFRGPKGVWTLEEKGLKPDINVSFTDAKPTKTHMIIKKFIDEGLAHFIVSQNIDGLHLKSGITREHLAELHGNMFVDQCNICKKQFIRSSPTPTVGLKVSGKQCKSKGRPCRGKLHDTILDWEDSLPDGDLDLSDMHSSLADLSICLGTTLQIVPSGNIPLNTLRTGGKLVICNLQPTKHDNKADLIINTYVDDIMENIANILGICIPSYNFEDDPTFISTTNVMEWTIKKSSIVKIKTMHRSKCIGVPKKRIIVKRPSDFKKSEKVKNEVEIDKTKKRSNKKSKSEKTIKKPKYDENIKQPQDDDNVIVINDIDSDGSDVVFISDDIDNKNDKSRCKDEPAKTINQSDESKTDLENGTDFKDAKELSVDEPLKEIDEIAVDEKCNKSNTKIEDDINNKSFDTESVQQATDAVSILSPSKLGSKTSNKDTNVEDDIKKESVDSHKEINLENVSQINDNLAICSKSKLSVVNDILSATKTEVAMELKEECEDVTVCLNKNIEIEDQKSFVKHLDTRGHSKPPYLSLFNGHAILEEK